MFHGCMVLELAEIAADDPLSVESSGVKSKGNRDSIIVPGGRGRGDGRGVSDGVEHH